MPYEANIIDRLSLIQETLVDHQLVLQLCIQAQTYQLAYDMVLQQAIMDYDTILLQHSQSFI
jgi:hypothetical protein